MQTISFRRVLHLSHVISPNIPQWTGDPAVEFETVATLENDGYYLRRFSLGEHSATHMNAPNSFHASGAGIDSYPAQSLVVSAVAMDISEKGAVNRDRTLTIADVLAWEQQEVNASREVPSREHCVDFHGEVTAGSVVLLYTGWQHKWSDSNAFFNRDARGELHFPGFGYEATQFLLNERQIAGIGIDTHGVDGGQDTTFSINRLVLEQPRIVLENLTNLEQLPPTGSKLVIGVLRLQEGSGSPVAVLALVP